MPQKSSAFGGKKRNVSNMIALWAPLRVLMSVNSFLLGIGRFAAWVALALMVLAILSQVFFRYVVGDALNWSEELARFLMLWMTGLIAPSAYRWGGFVAIDMVPRALPGGVGAVLNLILLVVGLLVLIVGVRLGWGEVTGFGGRFNSPTLKIPSDLTFTEWQPLKKKWMFSSLFVCGVLMVLVNVELILRALVSLLDPTREIPEDRAMIAAGSD